MYNKLIPAVALLIALMSCGPRPGAAPEPDTATSSSEAAQSMDPTPIRSVATHRPTRPPHDAAINGKIALRNNCVVLGPETGNFLAVPVFPESAVTFDETGHWFKYGGTRYEVGDEIHLGGSPVNQELDRFTDLQLNGCPQTGRLWMVG